MYGVSFTSRSTRVHNAMLGLRKLVKRYEYKAKEQRGPLLDVMRVTLPLLLSMSHQLVGDDSTEAGQVPIEHRYSTFVRFKKCLVVRK